MIWRRYVVSTQAPAHHPLQYANWPIASYRSTTDFPQEDSFQSKRAVRILMPDRLKSLLVDDWENITKNLQLVQLPSSEPAGAILDKYQDHALSTGHKSSTERDILEEVVAGLKEYFNKSLGRLLLYRFEREQFYDIYSRIDKPTDELAGKALCDIYGGEHLLRLFGKIARSAYF